jgi:hypothetical protein
VYLPESTCGFDPSASIQYVDYVRVWTRAD